MVIAKLLAKSPEDRYQSAYGLLDDLQQCRKLLTADGKLSPFELGRLDARRTLRFSEARYGREDAIRQLESGLEMAIGGGQSLRWVVGEAGSGITTLVQDLRHIAIRRGARFVEGVSSASRQSDTYEPLIQALRQWIQQLWSEPAEVLEKVKERLRTEFGREQRTIAALLPEAQPLFRTLGTISVVEDEGENNRRFGFILPRLLRCLTECLPALVLFIDRLEHADAGTLEVLRELAQGKAVSGLLVIGACGIALARREANATAASWLTDRMNDYPEERVALLPLGYEEVWRYIADTLHDRSLRTRLLARAAYNRTGGSPRELRRLMEDWLMEKKLAFDDWNRQWTWDEDAVRSAPNAQADLQRMNEHYAKLPEDSKALLAMGAAIGSSFGLLLLAGASGCLPEEAMVKLRVAETEGIVGCEDQKMPPGNGRDRSYVFLHDHLRRLAYACDAERNAQRHWRIGQLLRSDLQEGEGASLLAAIDHLNLGVAAMPEREAKQLAEDNLQAGLMVLEHADYALTIRYAETGLRLLGEPKEIESGSAYYRLKVMQSWALYMRGERVQARDLLLDLKSRGERLSRAERARIWTVLIQLHVFENDGSVIRYVGDALREYGWKINAHPSVPLTIKELLQTRFVLSRKLRQLPSRHAHPDSDFEALCGLMLELAFPMIVYSPAASMVLYARFIRYGIGEGMNEALVCLIGMYEVLLQRALPGFMRGSLFNELVNLPELNLSTSRYGYRLAYIKGMSVQMENPAEGWSYLEQALRRGLESGDNGFVNMSVVTCFITHTGDVYKLEALLDYFAKRVRPKANEKTTEIALIASGYAAALRDETKMERFIAIPNSGITPSEWQSDDNFSYCCKLEAAAVSGRYREALYWAKRARGNEMGADWVRIRKHRVHETLALAASYPYADSRERKRIRQALRKQLRKMTRWEGYLGVNSSAHKLLQAEWERIAGKPSDVLNEYWSAAKQARAEKNGLLEGIACERLAIYYEEELLSRSGAMVAMLDACAAYSQWGITHKVTQIRRERPDLTSSASKTYDALGWGVDDRASLGLPQPDDWVAQEIAASGDVGLRVVIGNDASEGEWPAQLLEAALRQTGADRGLVVSFGNDGFAIEARLDAMTTLGASALYAESVLRHTMGTKEPVVLADAYLSYFAKDAYFTEKGPRSVLSMPLTVPGEKAAFALYLENRHVSNVFASRDVSVLEWLATREIYRSLVANKHAATSEAYVAQEARSESDAIIEPLTARESAILSAIAAGLSNREIAEQFDIAETTVKTHTTRIFGKLGVKRRGQAVARAKVLDLL
ncbi:AAA family ATPase [Paenibacillus lycopersici]|uniref:AAA family ATPase n=1 Tax=Paenibacillus lycopersici TaxID=2704462 RepID=A0A6C0FTF0_9BACL|nr:LuxR family transcriptional regulator [Paenibacillus lycopersici]QHT58613.1 AAA family ATPase [Paenibacillus lycopersici]